MSNCMAVVTGLSLEYAPSVMGGEYETANTGTLGTQGNANGLFTVYNFQVADYHTYFAAPEADKPFVWVHNAGDKYGKGLLKNVTQNKNGGVDFSSSKALFPVKKGQKNVVRIEYTGSRKNDYKAANIEAGLGTTQKVPKDLKGNDYTWHHLDDYDPVTNTGTMQLIRRDVHQAALPHKGGVKQYEVAHGVIYD